MRDQYWLDIAHHLHIPPDAQRRMSMREWYQACQAIDQLRAEMEKG